MRTTTVCWNIVVQSVSSIIQDASNNIVNLVCDLLLCLLTVYISPDWPFHFCFYYCKLVAFATFGLIKLYAKINGKPWKKIYHRIFKNQLKYIRQCFVI